MCTNFYRFSMCVALLAVAVVAVYAQTAQGWMISADKGLYLDATSSQTMQSGKGSHTTITVDASVGYQTVDGFGWFLNEAGCKLIMQMSATNRINLLKELYAPDGKVRASVVRVAIGASDLSESDYTYSAYKDESLNNFSLEGPDLDYLIPVLKEIVSINPAVKVLAVPWTAPVWMKKNGGAHNGYMGGTLDSKYYAVYAKYFVKYIEAMAQQGIKIWAVSPQNEPLNEGNNPSMAMSKEDQYTFVENYLGPTLKSSGHGDVLIIGYDHNCDNTTYPIYVAKSQYMAGTAFHLYGGDISAMKKVFEQTGKGVYFTEQYLGSKDNFSGDFGWHMQNVEIGSILNFSKTVIEWNLASNAEMDMHTASGCNSCMGALVLKNGTVTDRTASYYVVAAMSRVVQSGAHRVMCSGGNNMMTTAFVNPDGTIGVVMYNQSGGDQTVDIVYNGKYASFTAPRNGTASILLSGTNAPMPPDYDPTSIGVRIHVTSAPARTDSIYLVGSWGGSWELDRAIPCKREKDGTWLGFVPETGRFEYKCWNRVRVNGQKTWEYEEAIDSKGTLRPQNREADYTKSKDEYIQVLYWAKQAEPVEPDPTLLPSVQETVVPRKVYRDGHVLILQNDRVFNVLGIEQKTY